MSASPQKIARVHCNQCGHETRHLIVAEHVHRDSEQVAREITIDWRDTYAMLECQGCKTVCVRHSQWFSEEPEDETQSFYPPRVSRRAPEWFNQLADDDQALLAEIYAALHADSRRLAMMGARTLIDRFLQAKVGDIGGFEQKLSALVEAGYLSKMNRDTLAAALDAGHAAAHRGHRPSSEELGHVMDIVENMLQADLLPSAATALRSKTPRRPPRGPDVKESDAT